LYLQKQKSNVLYLGLSILLALSVHFSQAQTFTVHHYGVAEGLPSSEVYDIFQDSKGFLWFATDNGVAKFDGLQMRVFNVPDGLLDPVVFETIEDPHNKIWIRTFSGRIASIENDRVVLYPFNRQLAKVCEKFYLTSMVMDPHGTLWFSTASLWGTIDSTGNITSHEIGINQVYCKTVGENSILVQNGGDKGFTILSIDDKSFSIKLSHHFGDPKFSHTVKRSVRWRNKLYVSINNNIFRYDGVTVERGYVTTLPIISLSLDKEDNLWVGLKGGGAIRYSSEDFSNPWTPFSINKNSVTDVLQDNEGGLWFSTLERGVLYLPNPELEHYYLNSESKIRATNSTPNSILIGTYDGALWIWDIHSKKLIKKQNFNGSILSLFSSSKQDWISTTGQVYILDKSFSMVKKNLFGNYLDFTEDPTGHIWAIESRGISRFDRDGNLILNKYQRMPHRSILATDSTLLIGLHTGLNVYDFNLNLLQSPESIRDLKIAEIVLLNDTTIIMATIGNGFIVGTKNFKKLVHYSSPAKNIYSVIKIDSTVWMGTENGILKIDAIPLLKNKLVYKSITNQSGLLRDQINLTSVTSTGDILALYDNGFTLIKKDFERFGNKDPKFYLKSLKINNQLSVYSSSISVPFDSNNIQIDFGFIAFNNQDLSIRYKLINENEWTYSSERSINLYSLSPGLYIPDVQFSADRVNWTSVQLPSIKIRPAWWQTSAFQIGSILGITGLLYLFFNNRLIIYRQRSEKMRLLSNLQEQLIQSEIETLERERSRIAKDLHDSVGTNILATKLSVSRLLKKHQDPEREIVEEQFQDTMQEIKEIIYNLSPPGLERYGLATGVKNYIERISTSTPVQFNVDVFGEELVNTNLSVPLFRILQELVTNSLKHSNATHISIHLNSFDDLYNIVYEDSGIGFSMGENHKGLGLHSIESRVKAIEGKIRFESGTFGVSYSIDVPIKK